MSTSNPAPNPREEPPKWEDLIDEWTDCAKGTVDRFAERARKNVKKARKGEYGVGEFFKDVRWFWKGVAEDASHLVESVEVPEGRRRTPGGGVP